jgi:thiol-disulfide isomerase/thioredoxin
MVVRSCRIGFVAGLVLLGVADVASAQPKVEAKQILAYRPRHKDVEVETPEAGDIAKCTLKVFREGRTSGYLVYGPDGQILRRFMDTDDADEQVDLFSYYLHGLEVYRDLDTNADNEIDQSRWLNTAGTRWGVDANQDGKIERWKVISAEEVTREAIRAMAAGDAAALAAVLVTAEDLEQAGVAGPVAGKVLEGVKNPEARLRSILAGSKVMKPTTRWSRFDTSMAMPNLVPVEPELTSRDLQVYENVIAMVDNAGKSDFVQIGEMLRVGDAWKLTRIPQPLEGDAPQVTEGGIFIQPRVVGGAMPVGDQSPEFRELITQLQKLDEAAPKPDAARESQIAYNTQRAVLLGKLAAAASAGEERETWLRQQVDGIAVAVQMDAYPDGVAALKTIESDVRALYKNSPLVPYVTFRRIMAENNEQLQKADAAQRASVQAAGLAALEKFVADYPQAEDLSDAMLQLAMALEFTGKVAPAKEWYGKIVALGAPSPAAVIANGALSRLNLKGNVLELAGPGLSGGTIDVARLRGKVVVVQFWATYCRPCTEDLPQIQEIYKQHKGDGLEIVGVNVDGPGAPIQQYLSQYKVTWPQIHEDGGLQGTIAQRYGVITLPTAFLVDKTGKVVSSSATVEDLKKQVPELLK